LKWTWQEKGASFLQSIVSIRVRFSEVDALGVAWHGHYLAYFEEGRNEFGREHGLGYADLRAAGYIAPVVHAEVDYFAPARFDDLLEVRARLYPDRGARINFSYRITDPRGEKLATGRTVQVFTEPDGSLVFTRPRFYQEFLDRWEGRMIAED
jgi:acyl-CoA thioester hydrolase